jgi:hypothetical protein
MVVPIERRPRKETVMFDPAAMGTLLIGLNGVERETRPIRARPARTVRRRHPGAVRRSVAAALRRAAASLEGPAIREIAR